MLFFALVSLAAAQISCPTLLAKPAATSVQDLRIDDIKVVTAIGDSITAAYAAKPKKDRNGAVGLGDLIEHRGVSFAMGGDAGASTLPNFIKQFNPNVVGVSLGQKFVAFNGHNANVDGLNAAITGSVVSGLQAQAEWVVDQMKSNSKINYANDFKYMNLLIGGNDICKSCNTPLNPDEFANSIRSVLTYLEKNVPRLIVNIPQMFKVSELWNLTSTDAYCDKRRASPLTVECACAFLEGSNGATKRAAMDLVTSQINQRIAAIRNDYVLKNSSSFMVTSDPATGTFSLVETGFSYLSDTDCFHPSLVAHSQLAKAMWANLFKPYDQKTTRVVNGTSFICPSSDSRIRF